MAAAGVVSRLRSSTEADSRKEEWKEATTRLVNALKAVEEPMLMSASKRLTATVRPIDHSGRAVCGSICVHKMVS